MGQYTVIGVCAVLAAISAAAIPSAGLVSMVMVMQVASLAFATTMITQEPYSCHDLCHSEHNAVIF